MGVTPFLGLFGREKHEVKFVSSVQEPAKRFKGHPKDLWPGLEKWFYNQYKNPFNKDLFS